MGVDGVHMYSSMGRPMHARGLPYVSTYAEPAGRPETNTPDTGDEYSPEVQDVSGNNASASVDMPCFETRFADDDSADKPCPDEAYPASEIPNAAQADPQTSEDVQKTGGVHQLAAFDDVLALVQSPQFVNVMADRRGSACDHVADLVSDPGSNVSDPVLGKGRCSYCHEVLDEGYCPVEESLPMCFACGSASCVSCGAPLGDAWE